MLVCVIHGALIDESGDDAFVSRVTNAAVLAWYEAHIAAEDAKRRPPLGVSEAMAGIPDDAMPVPPFPAPEGVHAIVDEAARLFDSELVAPAVAFGAALAWKAGHVEGSNCHGCSYRGHGPAFARAIREGHLRLELALVDDGGERFDYPGWGARKGIDRPQRS